MRCVPRAALDPLTGDVGVLVVSREGVGIGETATPSRQRAENLASAILRVATIGAIAIAPLRTAG